MMRLISPVVPTLLPSDTAARALEIMEDNRFTDLPVVLDDNYLGLVKETELLEWDNQEKHLGDVEMQAAKPAILVSAHPYEALRILNQLQLDILPVIDQEYKYKGAVSKDSLLQYIAETNGYDTPGGIIVLEIKPHNYSLYEVARLFENEDVIIIASQLNTLPDGTMELTLKTNRTALEAVISSLERHEYKVKEVFGDQKNMEDVMEKYQLLMNYLNM